jgi:hypothetical protein
MAQLDSRRSVISEFGLDPGSISVGFVVNDGALGPVFLFRILGFSPFQIIPQIFECIYRGRYIIRTIDSAIKYEGRYESNASHFFSETVINNVMKCTYSMCPSFTKVSFFSIESPSLSTTFYFLLCVTSCMQVA